MSKIPVSSLLKIFAHVVWFCSTIKWKLCLNTHEIRNIYFSFAGKHCDGRRALTALMLFSHHKKNQNQHSFHFAFIKILFQGAPLRTFNWNKSGDLAFRRKSISSNKGSSSYLKALEIVNFYPGDNRKYS